MNAMGGGHALDASGLEALALLHELGKRARAAASAAELGFVIVNETRQMLEYRQSALWWRDGGVAAVSGLPEADMQTPYAQWLARLSAAMDKTLEPGAVRAIESGDMDAVLAEDWAEWLPQYAAVAALRVPVSGERGCWLLARDTPWTPPELAALAELAPLYAHAWHPFIARTAWRRRARLALGRRARWIAACAVAVALVPVRLTVLAPAEVVPQDALLVRAPLDGVIDRLLVQPNQAVAAGTPLFELDATSLRARAGVANKAYEAAAEAYRQAAQMAVTDGDKGRLEMSQSRGRMEEKATELAYSQQLLDRVQVKAPRAGVLVFSDANEWRGKAVALGERVMQIADPDKVEVAIRLPAGDAIELDESAGITLYLSTAPQFSYDAQLVYAAYRAEAGPDGILAYKLRARLTESGAPPRLGLTGTAKLKGGWVPLSYWVLRRPLAALRQLVGW